jgi:hypothetical protein
MKDHDRYTEIAVRILIHIRHREGLPAALRAAAVMRTAMDDIIEHETVTCFPVEPTLDVLMRTPAWQGFMENMKAIAASYNRRVINAEKHKEAAQEKLAESRLAFTSYLEAHKRELGTEQYAYFVSKLNWLDAFDQPPPRAR